MRRRRRPGPGAGAGRSRGAAEQAQLLARRNVAVRGPLRQCGEFGAGVPAVLVRLVVVGSGVVPGHGPVGLGVGGVAAADDAAGAGRVTGQVDALAAARLDLLMRGAHGAPVQVPAHVWRSSSMPVTASTRAEKMTSATGAVTALP